MADEDVTGERGYDGKRTLYVSHLSVQGFHCTGFCILVNQIALPIPLPQRGTTMEFGVPGTAHH